MSKRLSAIFTAGFSSNDDKPSYQRGSTSLSPPDSSPEDISRSRSPAKLSKQAPTYSEARRASTQYLMTPENSQPSLRDLGRSESSSALQPPPSVAQPGNSSGTRSRPVSPWSRPPTPSLIIPEEEPASPPRKTRWWSRKSDKHRDPDKGPVAWIAGHPQKLPYDVEGLRSGMPMQELWNEVAGNCYVYLFPKSSKKGASFKVDSSIFASSGPLTKLAFGDAQGNAAASSGDRRQPGTSVNDPATPPLTPKRNAPINSTWSQPAHRQNANFSEPVQELHLYLPIRLGADKAIQSTSALKSEQRAALEELQTLIDYRNLFAFLAGQSLVATEGRQSIFSIFSVIAGILKSYQFTNADGSTFGEVANASFDAYIAELGLADVRTSREKTIEMIVLGERMKNVLLYNEAFTHGVGKQHDLLAMKHPKFSSISPITQNRLTRAAMDLDKRVASIRLIMTDFDFPFLFSGIMSSKTSTERKEGVRFAQWKESFMGMRRFMLGLLKQRYGDWPPKASSKKNSLETSGLNRLVLKDVYADLSALYDHLADRTNLTTRTLDGASLEDSREAPVVRGLRAILSEYDRSSPPVKPPVPFDLPLLPTIQTIRPKFSPTDLKSAKILQKRLKEDELAAVLRASHNDDVPMVPFVAAFREMEKRAASGCTLMEVEDLRIGQWIFLYVVLQALPMLACDAPGLKHTAGVEYFLCAPPRSGVPWADSNAGAAAAGKRTWFSVGGAGGGVVSLPSDVVEHGVEGIYHRSHCWRMAEKWCAANPILNEALQMQQHTSGGAEQDHSSPDSAQGKLLTPPVPPFSSVNDLSRPASVASNRSSNAQKRLSSFGLNLEALPLPAGVTPDGRAPSPGERSRTPVHSVDASRTFEAILATGADGKGKKKGRK